ncbi:MAG: hypothetical protein AcusKO_15390 [Acuticoccus sp.]
MQNAAKPPFHRPPPLAGSYRAPRATAEDLYGPPVTVFISGASNSVMVDGWTKYFRDRVGRREKIENLSVGGSSSLMSAYRVCTRDDIKNGDTIIWENVIGDEGRIYCGTMTVELGLKYCEYVIQHAIRCGARFIPILLLPRAMEACKEQTEYIKALRSLFDYYGLQYIDVSSELRARRGRETLPSSLYVDGGHFAPDGRVVQFIARRCTRFYNKEPNHPRQRAPLHVASGQQMALLTALKGHSPTTFENSLLAVPAYERLDLPVETEPAAFSGELTGFLFIAKCQRGGVCRLRVGEETIPISAAPAGDEDWTALFCTSLPGLLGRPIPIGQGETVHITPAERTDTPHNDGIFRNDIPPGFDLQRPDIRIVGFLCEVGG